MDHVDVSADVHGLPGPAIDIAAIERKLADLWRAPKVVGLRESDVVPTRTSVLNLVVYAGSPALAERSTRIIGHLAADHPSRAIILEVNNDPEAFAGTLDARVSTQCYSTPGEHFAACFEQIVITTPPDSLDYLTSIFVPLSLPDLPIFIWWLGQPPFHDRRFAEVTSTADRLILDSLYFDQAPASIQRMAALCHQLGNACVMSDLNWARLVHWREMTAQFFDLPECQGALDHLTQLELSYGRAAGSPDNPAQALLYLGWLANRLSWRIESTERNDDQGWTIVVNDHHRQRIAIDLTSRPTIEAFSGYLLSTRLVADDGTLTRDFSVERIGDDLMTIKMTASAGPELRREQAVLAPPLLHRHLLMHELKRLTEDPVFSDALQEAGHYAEGIKYRSTT